MLVTRRVSMGSMVQCGYTHLSVFNLIIMIKAPWNLTFSSGRVSKSRAMDHALGELWSCVRAAWVAAMTSGLFGW